MPKRKSFETSVSPLLKQIVINFASSEDKRQVEDASSILSYKFDVKAVEEEWKENGRTHRSTNYYLLFNGHLIAVVFGSDEKREFFNAQVNYIEKYLESELINSALRTFHLSSLAAGSQVFNSQKKLYRQLYKFSNIEAGRKDSTRRNLLLNIKSGRPPGSKKSKKYAKAELYEKLSKLVRSYYGQEDIEPTQDIMAKALDLGYDKRLHRMLHSYGEKRDWRTLVKDILAGTK